MTACVLGLLVAALQALAGEGRQYHDGVDLLSGFPHGRSILMSNGRLGAVSGETFVVSDNNGQEWNAVGRIDTGDAPPAKEGLLLETLNGVLVLVYRDDGSVHLERTPDNMPLPGANLDVWAVRSVDGGKIWQDAQILLDGYCGAMYDLICTRDNKIVIPLQDLRYDPPRNVTVVKWSEDDGETWTTPQILDIGGYGLEDGGFEPSLTERVDGSLLMFIRTTRDRLWYSISEDQGVSWTLPTPTDIQASNSPAFLLSLRGGRIAMAWNPLHPTHASPWPRLELYPTDKDAWPRRTRRYADRPDNVYREELLLAFSDDGGSTWTEPEVLAWETGARVCYPYMFERRPGVIWLVVGGQWMEIDVERFIRDEVP